MLDSARDIEAQINSMVLDSLYNYSIGRRRRQKDIGNYLGPCNTLGSSNAPCCFSLHLAGSTFYVMAIILDGGNLAPVRFPKMP